MLEVRGQSRSGHIWKKNIVNMILTNQVCASSSNLEDILTMIMDDPIDFFIQRSMVKVIHDIFGNNTLET